VSTDRRRSNPSTILYWVDLRDDPKLRRCSPAAKGLWAVHMLPAAAESPEYGVVIVDGLSSLQQDLGELFSREIGEPPDVAQVLVDELVRMGAASVDDRGRVYCRRMVREEDLRQKRSSAGKLGAAAKWQTDGKPHGKPYAKEHGEQDGENDGKSASAAEGENTDSAGLNDTSAESGQWQTDGEGDGKSMPSSHPSLPSLPSLSSHPSHPSLEKNLVPYGTRDDDDDGVAAFNAWNEAAERVGRWPKPRKLDADRRKAIRARLKDCDGVEGFKAVLAKAEASRFCREQMSGFAFDWFLTAGNFRKVSEGNYDDDRQNASAAPGHVDALRDVVGAFRRKEQSQGWN
jgi:hypothetical protein